MSDFVFTDKYKHFPVRNSYLGEQIQANGSVASRIVGGFNVYDGAQNWMGYFDAELTWHSNVGTCDLSKSWEDAARAVLKENGLITE